jgi:hypothetical protein
MAKVKMMRLTRRAVTAHRKMFPVCSKESWMRIRSRAITVPLLWAGITAATLAQAPPAPKLNVKLGLWEMTTSVNLGGEMPGMTGMDMSKMTPEQQAQMQAAMKAMMGAHTSVNKTCMTKEKLDSSTFMMPDGANATCKPTIGTNTATTLDADVSCTGAETTKAHVHIVATSPTAITGTASATTSQAGKTMTMDLKTSGKWIAAACGDVD